MYKALFLGFSALAAVEAKKKCPGHFGGKYSAVTNLCEAHFPDASSEKIWFIKFYAPWCGHCNNMKPAWEQIGKELKDDSAIGIGAVDCDAEANKPLCGKYGVQGFPTIKAIVGGKAKSYNGARDAAPMKQYILNLKEKRGSKGGSSKCQKGIFKSTVKDSIVPLCAKHYPDPKTSKNSWVIAFYNKDDFAKSDEVNRLALELGNEPVDKSKQRKKIIKQSERIKEVASKYDIKNELTKKAGKSKDLMVKFGAICCDCEKGKVDEKCEGLTLPHMRVFNSKTRKDHEYPAGADFNIDKFAAFTLEKLDFVKASAKEGKEEL